VGLLGGDYGERIRHLEDTFLEDPFHLVIENGFDIRKRRNEMRNVKEWVRRR